MPDYYGVADEDGQSSVKPRRDLVLLAIFLGVVIILVVLYWLL
jgi:hypothetical protein